MTTIKTRKRQFPKITSTHGLVSPMCFWSDLGYGEHLLEICLSTRSAVAPAGGIHFAGLCPKTKSWHAMSQKRASMPTFHALCKYCLAVCDMCTIVVRHAKELCTSFMNILRNMLWCTSFVRNVYSPKFRLLYFLRLS